MKRISFPPQKKIRKALRNRQKWRKKIKKFYCIPTLILFAFFSHQLWYSYLAFFLGAEEIAKKLSNVSRAVRRKRLWRTTNTRTTYWFDKISADTTKRTNKHFKFIVPDDELNLMLFLNRDNGLKCLRFFFFWLENK